MSENSENQEPKTPLIDNPALTEYYRKWAKKWRDARETARYDGDFYRYEQARKECNNYASKLPENERHEFWQD
ncbi:hypothetical protein [Wielerella bovis]|uniref:hypothetical protein n=1 Tax=Wielerella bovis TaxID=2917790 RepID=UPI002019C82F|nr:hypothetical protein [Wielerella bovis]MCG7657146.1 hypothetical protein [Wielerella bovis]MCG7659369.1 hypothetical protein [Wielerella bovis]ULJ60798.1 hypothetical protein MIS44_02750 [Wielerella bovis]